MLRPCKHSNSLMTIFTQWGLRRKKVVKLTNEARCRNDNFWVTEVLTLRSLVSAHGLLHPPCPVSCHPMRGSPRHHCCPIHSHPGTAPRASSPSDWAEKLLAGCPESARTCGGAGETTVLSWPCWTVGCWLAQCHTDWLCFACSQRSC